MITFFLHKFTKLSNCYPPCVTNKFDILSVSMLRFPMAMREDGEQMALRIYSSAPSLTVKTEYLVYTFGDFLSDCGGLMGMLVGVSFLSIYDKLADILYSLQMKVVKRNIV